MLEISCLLLTCRMGSDWIERCQPVVPSRVRTRRHRPWRVDRRCHQLDHLLDCRLHVRVAPLIEATLTSSGAFITDPLNHYFGRRGEIFITAACLTATPIASGFAKSWQALFAIRFVMGIGIGAKNATVPIFSAELAPARIRGALVMFWQLWVVAGEFWNVNRDAASLTRRYFLGFLRERHRQRHWQDFVAIAAGFRFHPGILPYDRNLLHSWFVRPFVFWHHSLTFRVPAMAYEARQVRQSLPLVPQASRAPHHLGTRLLLLACDLRGGATSFAQLELLLPNEGLLHHPPNQASELRSFDGHARTADVRN